MRQIETLSVSISRTDDRDSAIAGLAKLYIIDGTIDKAIALLESIKNPDKQAQSIRSIAASAADQDWNTQKYNTLWLKLSALAGQFRQAGPRGEALSGIAAAQALSGNADAARKSSLALENTALREKTFADIARIFAERGDVKSTLASIDTMQPSAMKRDTLVDASRIFLDKAMIEEAYICASRIDDPYMRTRSLERILSDKENDVKDAIPNQPGTE